MATLVNRWRFNETSGTSAADSVGGINLTLSGSIGTPAWVAGKYGNAIDISAAGSDNHRADGGTSFNVPNNFTVTGWYKWQGAADSKSVGTVLSKNSTTDAAGHVLMFNINATSSEHRVVLRAGGTTDTWVVVDTALTEDVWYFFAIRYNGTTMEFYTSLTDAWYSQAHSVGGNVDNTPASGTPRWVIGNRWDSSGGSYVEPFPGQIDDLRVYNGVLTNAEVEDVRKNIEADWRLDETSGTAMVDSLGNHNGVFTGAGGYTLGVASLMASGAGTAVEFNGSTGYVDLSADATVFCSSAQPFTITALIKLDGYGVEAFPAILSLKTNGNFPFTIFPSVSAGYNGINLGCRNTTGTTFSSFLATVPPSLPGGVYHIAVAYNGGGGTTAANFKCYINGVPLTVVVNTNTYTNVGNMSFLAAYPGNIGWDGVLDKIRVYGSELSEAQIVAQYEDLLGTGDTEIDGGVASTIVSTTGTDVSITAHVFVDGGVAGTVVSATEANVSTSDNVEVGGGVAGTVSAALGAAVDITDHVFIDGGVASTLVAAPGSAVDVTGNVLINGGIAETEVSAPGSSVVITENVMISGGVAGTLVASIGADVSITQHVFINGGIAGAISGGIGGAVQTSEHVQTNGGLAATVVASVGGSVLITDHVVISGGIAETTVAAAGGALQTTDHTFVDGGVAESLTSAPGGSVTITGHIFIDSGIANCISQGIGGQVTVTIEIDGGMAVTLCQAIGAAVDITDRVIIDGGIAEVVSTAAVVDPVTGDELPEGSFTATISIGPLITGQVEIH